MQSIGYFIFFIIDSTLKTKEEFTIFLGASAVYAAISYSIVAFSFDFRVINNVEVKDVNDVDKAALVN